MARTARFRMGAVAASVTLALGVVACGSDDDGGSGGTTGTGGTQTIQLMMYPGQTYRAPILIAEQEGFLEKRGIKITTVPQPTNITGIQGLTATKSDVGIVATGTLAQGWQAGSKVAFFCGGIKVLQTSLVVKPDSTLPSTESGATWQDVLKSLSGKKIGVQTPIGSGLQKVFAAALEAAGVTDVTYVNLGTQAQIVQASLANGSVDAAQTNPTATEQLLTAKSVKRIIYMPDGPPEYQNYYGSGWVATTDWLTANPKLAADFCAAYDEGLQFIADDANKDKVNALLEKDTGVNADVADLVRTTTFEDFDTTIPADKFQETLDAYVKLGVLKPDPAPKASELIVVPQG